MRAKLKPLTGIVLCMCGAILLSLVMRDPDIRLIAPMLCILVVIGVAFRWGRAAAILGAGTANLIFDFFLFPPLGSIRVSDPAEVMSMALLQVSAVSVAILIRPDNNKEDLR
jgi:K+-sensing histidine kinase KdpD